MKLAITKLPLSPDRPWLVMLHGFGGSYATWKKQVTNFSDRFNLMVIELPGHGESADGIAEEPEADLQNVAQLVLDALHREGIYRAHFLALSLGTLVLAGILQAEPEMVESVVLCGAVFGMGFLSKLALYLGNTLKHIFPYMVVAGLMASILMPRPSHKLSRKFLVRECKKLGRAEFMRWYTLFIREVNRLSRNRLLLNRAPCLVVMGQEDYVFLSRAKQAVSALGSRVRLVVMQNCGHVCNVQQAAEFNRIADHFFCPGQNPTAPTGASLPPAAQK